MSTAMSEYYKKEYLDSSHRASLLYNEFEDIWFKETGFIATKFTFEAGDTERFCRIFKILSCGNKNRVNYVLWDKEAKERIVESDNYEIIKAAFRDCNREV